MASSSTIINSYPYLVSVGAILDQRAHEGALSSQGWRESWQGRHAVQMRGIGGGVDGDGLAA